ncbi:site-specific DNA-methyltransferase [Moraxella osloensis]|uniref:site-specific DNA-methyltransferase (adenine-specific) n=1 Tax=Faucicola osloensis TaxID=34062 RepID=A0A378QBN0_FAUOS|nr:site-specific DNA-methyltransferase [Moraxella osloensis]STY98253.1 putative methyltransferase [Moraxella osloensis]
MPSSNLKMHTPNLVDSNIERIAELFPNCITEKPKTDEQGNVLKDASGQAILERGIDFELLKQELSHSVIDGSQERYRLDWVGKREAIVTANSPIAKTLRPCRAESVDFDTTGNLFIEGDNLEALKLLQESYLGKVKMIYIDPPYNTGNDFIYNDDFAADTAAFFERSGQVDADGNRLVANTERNGRFHSDWLSMMYSRLKLARNLLSDDGMIFISIDENEVQNLRKVCDEVFGQYNFINMFIWQKNSSGKTVSKQFPINVEYVFFYAKNLLKHSFNTVYKPLSETTIKMYNKDDNDGRGKYRLYPLQKTGGAGPETTYDYIDNNGRVWKCPKKGWRMNKDKLKLLENDGRLDFGKNTLSEKAYWIERESEGKIADTLWNDLDEGNVGTAEVYKLFEFVAFDYPKPVGLISRILSVGLGKNDLVLDFFAGSSTTAHAVMQLNAEDGGNRKFIMVQIPEATDSKSEAFKAGYPTIAEISKERIRRAGAKIKADNADKEGINELDTGFRVLKIDTTNMNDIYYRPQDYSQDLLHQLENNIKEDRTDEDLLFQFMLDTGVPLSLPIERTAIGGHTIYQVGGNSLIASLDYIDANMVNDIAALNPLKFITSERAIATDSDKTNIKERFKQLSPHTDVRFI